MTCGNDKFGDIEEARQHEQNLKGRKRFYYLWERPLAGWRLVTMILVS